MNEFIVFSDIQFYRNSSKSYILSNGMTSWFKTQLDITKEIFEYAIENSVHEIIFNGDLFEQKNNINVSIYNEVWNLFKEYSDRLFIKLNTGNHDIHTFNRSSSLKPFTDIAHVISKPYDYIIYPNTYVRILPYGMIEDNLKLPDEKDYDCYILFTHENIAGLELGPTDYESGSLLKPQIFGDWDFVFNGHIHRPQCINNIINIGSPMIQDWGEANETKRFIHFENGEIVSIPTNCPKFLTVDSITDKVISKIEKNDYDFFRIDISPDELNNPIFEKYNVFPNIVKSRDSTMRLGKVENEEEEIEKYVEMFNISLNKDKLVEIGKQIIKRSRDDSNSIE